MSKSRKRFSRRNLLIGGGVLVAGCAAIPIGGGATFFLANQPDSTVGKIDFRNPLSIPPLLDPEPDEDGRKVFDLTLQTGQTQILPAGPAETWGVNGPFLGPTIRARRGDRVSLAVHNELPEDSTIHWHGMHLPSEMDGGPHQMIPVGISWTPEWTIDQPASTLWYHPHPHGATAEHVYRGVAGLFLIDDDESDALGLPHEYSIDDIPLIIQDKNFTDDGDLTMDTGSFFDQLGGSANFGVLGDTMLVNGTYAPVFEPTRQLTRFRILNGGNARFLNLGFADNRPFHLVATDNGVLPGEPERMTRLLLGPGERAGIVVEFRPGDEVVMRSFEQDLGGGGRQIGANDTFDVIQFRASSTLEASAALPEHLGGIPSPEVPDNALVRSFRLDGHGSINGEKMDMSRIDEVVPAGALEIWKVESSGQPHTFHIHGATFHVLDVDGGTPGTALRGPKDTVFVGPGHPVTLAVQFDTYTDPDTPYMYHCHILKHEDNGMMGQFVVVEPGTEDATPRTIEGHLHH